jgi:putative PIN family toxin of toxin-antitoxin system
MLGEVARVLSYPKISRRIRWDAEKIARYIALLRFEASVVNVEGVAAHVPGDPNDDFVLATLIASEADYLVTGDEDLLSLAGQYPIVSPGEFMARML